MARRGPTLAELQLSEDERATLERWARRPKSEQSRQAQGRHPPVDARHGPPAIETWLLRHPRFHFHFTRISDLGR